MSLAGDRSAGGDVSRVVAPPPISGAVRSPRRFDYEHIRCKLFRQPLLKAIFFRPQPPQFRWLASFWQLAEMAHGFTWADRRQTDHTDYHPIKWRQQRASFPAQQCRVGRQRLTFLNDVARFDVESHKAAQFGPDPFRFLDDDLIGRTFRGAVEHVETAQHIFNATRRRFDDARFHFPHFAAFHDDRRAARLARFSVGMHPWGRLSR